MRQLVQVNKLTSTPTFVVARQNQSRNTLRAGAQIPFGLIRTLSTIDEPKPKLSAKRPKPSRGVSVVFAGQTRRLWLVAVKLVKPLVWPYHVLLRLMPCGVEGVITASTLFAPAKQKRQKYLKAC